MRLVIRETRPNRKSFVFVALDLINDLSFLVADINEPDSRIICRYHDRVRVKELNASHLSSTGKLSSAVSAIYDLKKS